MTKASPHPKTDVQFDPDRVARRLEGALAAAGDDPKKIARAHRRARADVAAPIDAAGKLGASLPEMALLFKASWRVELAAVPAGDQFKEAMPAYVVRFDGNSPLERLRIKGVLDRPQCEAAAKFVGMWVAAVKTPRTTASYDGIIAQGGVAPAPWVDVYSDSWKRLREALGALLPVEFEIVRDVSVYERSIEDMAKQPGLVRLRDVARAKGAIVQTLSCGLTRLSNYWGLDARQPRDAST